MTTRWIRRWLPAAALLVAACGEVPSSAPPPEESGVATIPARNPAAELTFFGLNAPGDDLWRARSAHAANPVTDESLGS